MAKRKKREVTPPAETAKEPAAPARTRLPRRFIVTTVAASLNLTAGMLGLVFPESFPVLAKPPVMITLLASGIGLEIWSVKLLMAAKRAAGELRVR